MPALHQGLESYEVLQKTIYPFNMDDMQKREYSRKANFSRLFNAILVHYENFLGWQGKEPELVGTGKHPTLVRVGMIYRSAELLVINLTNSRIGMKTNYEELNMGAIGTFLSNPLVALAGYVFSLIAAVIAIWQFLRKSEALKELAVLKVEITTLSEENTNLQSTINNNNRILQGEKSQYFQENSGPVNIDNRG